MVRTVDDINFALEQASSLKIMQAVTTGVRWLLPQAYHPQGIAITDDTYCLVYNDTGRGLLFMYDRTTLRRKNKAPIHLTPEDNRYNHPGGIQAANNILAVNFQKHCLFPPSYSRAYIVLYDINDLTKKKELYMNANSSFPAVGIVCTEDTGTTQKYIVLCAGIGFQVEVTNGDLPGANVEELEVSKDSLLTNEQSLNLVMTKNKEIYAISSQGGKKEEIGLYKLIKEGDKKYKLQQCYKRTVESEVARVTCSAAVGVEVVDGQILLYVTDKPERWSEMVCIGISEGKNGYTLGYQYNGQNITRWGALNNGQYLLSLSRRFAAVMQRDNNFVVYTTERPIWSTDTYNIGKEGTGKIVIDRRGMVALEGIDKRWSNGKRGAYKLALEDDGNLAAYTKDKELVWKSSEIDYSGEPGGRFNIGMKINN